MVQVSSDWRKTPDLQEDEFLTNEVSSRISARGLRIWSAEEDGAVRFKARFELPDGHHLTVSNDLFEKNADRTPFRTDRGIDFIAIEIYHVLQKYPWADGWYGDTRQ